ncbi:MAG TPA: Stk1 family PASTA domain-containing Ser/Thr kinase [Intrasporangium sp.]|uniref:Stk1 family PASTA domain-containing Ser/Thr kinase n=1 Tax=Intrasporangium sp. TaxID=1925024 RepID=UPI002D793EE9|nr:Stk1 family PASTA domain-containing Ser/Thr kinase [Intrasporangium sp.]HET7397432.1 Stk1 family PASTA domain-containing Ser/Thr kinase [Intrasporangium sp.]
MTSSVADALVGRVIDGRYRVLSHLADGGMASVYVAMDGRLDREVALKIMRPALARDAVFVERFRREARASARLTHPNVVAVYDQGDDGGEVFLAMELVEGKTLREVIHEEAPLTARESLAILEPILEALRAAHTAGLIHRDVKPENVLIRADGEVKVADFGLARAVTNQTATSQTGILLGTVSYLSPEQVERGVADPRSDVYAAGLLLFEMLTGRKAVTGETPIQIAYRHVHGTIDPPSAVVRDVPQVLDDLVARATATDPAARFETTAAFLAAVRGTRAGLPAADLDRRPRPPSGFGSPAGAHSASAASPMLPAPTAPTPVPRTGAPPADGPALSPTTALPVDRGRRTRRRWPLWVALLMAVVLAAGGGWWFTAGPGAPTTVPAVTGAPLQAAVAALERASLRAARSESYSETAGKGTVISAEPRAGAQVGKQTTVNLVVSKGPERYAVPRLVGRPADAAASALAPLTLTLGGRTDEWSETVPAGVVLRQDPAEGASVKRGTPVGVVVSKGRQPIPVPTLQGLPLAKATNALETAGLRVTRAPDVNSDIVPTGSVISASPASGTLFRGDTVTLTVSKGPVLVQVPNVIGRDTATAERVLTALGFRVSKEYPFGRLFDLVRVQSIEGGRSVPKGSSIVLTIV